MIGLLKQYDHETKTAAGETLETQHMYAKVQRSLRRMLKRNWMMVEEVHAAQGAQYQRKGNNTLECKFCGKTHEKNNQKCSAFRKK